MYSLLKNQDINYITGILTAIISVLILHNYISVPSIFAHPIINMLFLIIIIVISRNNIFLGLIITFLFLVLNSHANVVNYVEKFQDSQEEEGEEEETGDEEAEEEENEEENEEESKETDSSEGDENVESPCRDGHEYSFETGEPCKKRNNKKRKKKRNRK